MSYGEQSSQQKSEQGVFQGSPTGLGQARNVFSQLLLGPNRASDTTRGEGGILGDLFSRTQAPTNYVTPTLTSTGLLPEQEAGLRAPFEQAVQQALGRTSGNYAMRGFNRPENIQAIAGSAAANVAPQFANLMANLAGQNVGQRTQAPLIQEDIIRNRFLTVLQGLGLIPGSAGGTSFGGSSGWNAGFGGNITAGNTTTITPGK